MGYYNNLIDEARKVDKASVNNPLSINNNKTDEKQQSQSTSPEDFTHKNQTPGLYTYCPTCFRPYYSNPWPSKDPLYKKKFLRIPIWGWVIGILILLVFSCIIAGILIGPQEHIKNYSTEVIISEGGHFQYSLGYVWDEIEISFNVSSQDEKRFDIYIMDEDQYENAYNIIAYDIINTSIMAFSSLYSYENITRIADSILLREDYGGSKEFYFVIDNRDTLITPDDAIPDGIIIINVDITLKSEYYWD